MNINAIETEFAEQILVQAIDCASSYSEDHDLDAAVIALLVRALEIAAGKVINIHQVYQ
jgi:hypothetical protein